MNDTCGPMSGTQFAFYDHDSQSWKMWPDIGLWGSIEYLETWPKMGYMQNGQAFELATWGGHTTGNASSYSQHLPNPKASDCRHGDSPAEARRKSPSLTSVSVYFGKQQYLPTPKASDGARGEDTPSERRRDNPALTAISVYFPGNERYLPTPNTMDSLPVREGEAGEKQLRRGDMSAPRRRSMGNLREDIVHETAGVSTFGPYEAVVHRWEQITRPAPEPTELDSKGKPRLSVRFAEWMMGLPEGWVTSPDIGLSRAQQLKAIGNGVCPLQAATALKELIGR